MRSIWLEIEFKLMYTESCEPFVKTNHYRNKKKNYSQKKSAVKVVEFSKPMKCDMCKTCFM